MKRNAIKASELKVALFLEKINVDDLSLPLLRNEVKGWWIDSRRSFFHASESIEVLESVDLQSIAFIGDFWDVGGDSIQITCENDAINLIWNVDFTVNGTFVWGR